MNAAELREIRNNMGLSQQALADKIGVKMMTVWRWEHEKRRISQPMSRLIQQIRILHESQRNIPS